jgi:hypothetical protein
MPEQTSVFAHPLDSFSQLHREGYCLDLLHTVQFHANLVLTPRRELGLTPSKHKLGLTPSDTLFHILTLRLFTRATLHPCTL